MFWRKNKKVDPFIKECIPIFNYIDKMERECHTIVEINETDFDKLVCYRFRTSCEMGFGYEEIVKISNQKLNDGRLFFNRYGVKVVRGLKSKIRDERIDDIINN